MSEEIQDILKWVAVILVIGLVLAALGRLPQGQTSQPDQQSAVNECDPGQSSC